MPVWLISPEFKSQVGAGKGRVLNPERSPSAPALILPWSWLIFWHLSGRKPRCFCPVSLGLCLGFFLHSCCPGLPAEKPLCTAELDTHTSSLWQESVYAFAMCPSRGRKTCPWSQPARHEVAARWFTILFVWAVKKKKNVWHLSIQVQAVKREARAVMGSVHTMLLFHINNKHQLSIRCRQMKAIS